LYGIGRRATRDRRDVRLARLVDATAEYRVLAPLAIREIVYRVLTGA
jgi:hypothetical protein